MNTKYEITDIAHEKYPFLHRIRALRDIGSEVKAGDLGGFVEGESNLSSRREITPGSLTMPSPPGKAVWTRAPSCGRGPLSAAVLMPPTARKCPAIPEPRMTLTSGEPD